MGLVNRLFHCGQAGVATRGEPPPADAGGAHALAQPTEEQAETQGRMEAELAAQRARREQASRRE